jgi:hypothetical protein
VGAVGAFVGAAVGDLVGGWQFNLGPDVMQ